MLEIGLIGRNALHKGSCYADGIAFKRCSHEIDGDTTGLQSTLKEVNSSIKTTPSSLKDVNKLPQPEGLRHPHRSRYNHNELPQREVKQHPAMTWMSWQGFCCF
jgi:hypothetical protein